MFEGSPVFSTLANIAEDDNHKACDQLGHID